MKMPDMRAPREEWDRWYREHKERGRIACHYQLRRKAKKQAAKKAQAEAVKRAKQPKPIGKRGWKPKNAAEYRRYLSSKWWKRRRARAIAAVGGRCQSCQSVLDIQVHHLDYSRLYGERDSDLLVLCRACHEDAGMADAFGVSLVAMQERLS